MQIHIFNTTVYILRCFLQSIHWNNIAEQVHSQKLMHMQIPICLYVCADIYCTLRWSSLHSTICCFIYLFFIFYFAQYCFIFNQPDQFSCCWRVLHSAVESLEFALWTGTFISDLRVRLPPHRAHLFLTSRARIFTNEKQNSMIIFFHFHCASDKSRQLAVRFLYPLQQQIYTESAIR